MTFAEGLMLVAFGALLMRSFVQDGRLDSLRALYELNEKHVDLLAKAIDDLEEAAPDKEPG